MRLNCPLDRHHAGRSADIEQGTVFQCKACDHVMIAKHWGFHAGQSGWVTPAEAVSMLGEGADVVRKLPKPMWEAAKQRCQG